MVGMSRESMNKQLGQWRREDLIRMDDGYITIPDLDRLREI
jgi:CRP-like cAMP-binding protein